MEIELLSRYPLSVKIKLTEGKKNEIRIAFDHIGLPVSKLHRESYGLVELGDLHSGKWRKLSNKEIANLKS
jgi:23S rRNA pseudouridine2605 synthase